MAERFSTTFWRTSPVPSLIAFVILPAFVFQPALAFQNVQPAKSALERRGLYHASVHGRFVSPAGEPIAGVHVQLNAGRVRALPLADVVTGPDGRFSFRDFSSPYMPDLSWYPPELWLRGGSALMVETGTDVDAGTIRLRPDTIIRVAVEIVGDARAPRNNITSNLPLAANLEPTVVLQSNSQPGPRVVAQRIGSNLVLRQIPFDDGNLEVSLYRNGKSEKYRARLHIDRGRRDQLFHLRLLRNTAKPQNQYSSVGEMEVSEGLLPPVALEREFRASGRILAPDGTPVEGAFVGLNDFFFHRATPQWTVSSARGGFQFTYTATECGEPSVSYGSTDYWFLPLDPTLTASTCEERWRGPRDLTMQEATRLQIKVDAVSASNFRAYWWHDSFGWQKFSSLQPWISAADLGEKRVKIEADGFLPAVKTLELAYANGLDARKAPESITAEFRLDRATRRELLVLGNGEALSGATVDLEEIVDLAKDQRQFLETYQTPADGRIRLAGGPDQMVEVFVYADGYEPRRAIWNPGSALTLGLVPRSATLSFAASSSATMARVREAGRANAVRTVILNTTRASTLTVATGSFDVTFYGNQGSVTGYQRVDVAAAQTKGVDEAVDQRPRVTVRYPADGWHADISESVPHGGATGWSVMLSVGGTLTFTDKPATLEREAGREAVFRLSHAGRMHIEIRRAGQTLSLWRDIDARPGESITLDVPPATANLKGSMSSYQGNLGFSIHGWAGPRMQLISDDSIGWSATEYLPARDGTDGDFTVKGIPAGHYHVYQHLIGESKAFATPTGRQTQYVGPIAAWGGVPVTLEAGKTAHLRDFIEYPFQGLRLRITDQAGRPLDHGTVRIRDRMSESWRQVEENPARLEEPSDPIPYPAAARLVSGAATLPRVRAGWLDLLVELDSGAVYSFTTPVAPGQELRLTVPGASVVRRK